MAIWPTKRVRHFIERQGFKEIGDTTWQHPECGIIRYSSSLEEWLGKVNPNSGRMRKFDTAKDAVEALTKSYRARLKCLDLYKSVLSEKYGAPVLLITKHDPYYVQMCHFNGCTIIVADNMAHLLRMLKAGYPEAEKREKK